MLQRYIFYFKYGMIGEKIFSFFSKISIFSVPLKILFVCTYCCKKVIDSLLCKLKNLNMVLFLHILTTD